MRHLGDATKIDGAEIEPVDIITFGERQSRMYKVYKYTFPNGKVYIGTTKNTLQERKDSGYQHNARLTNAIREVGWKNVGKEIIASGMTQEEAFEEEKRQISLHDSRNPNLGYNISIGGKCTFAGLNHSEEHRRKMSDLYRGKTWSKEALRHMKEGHAKERKPVVCFNSLGISERYESLAKAAESICGNKTNISRACKSGKPYKGFLWRFESHEEVV